MGTVRLLGQDVMRRRWIRTIASTCVFAGSLILIDIVVHGVPATFNAKGLAGVAVETVIFLVLISQTEHRYDHSPDPIAVGTDDETVGPDGGASDKKMKERPR